MFVRPETYPNEYIWDDPFSLPFQSSGKRAHVKTVLSVAVSTAFFVTITLSRIQSFAELVGDVSWADRTRAAESERGERSKGLREQKQSTKRGVKQRRGGGKRERER